MLQDPLAGNVGGQGSPMWEHKGLGWKHSLEKRIHEGELCPGNTQMEATAESPGGELPEKSLAEAPIPRTEFQGLLGIPLSRHRMIPSLIP